MNTIYDAVIVISFAAAVFFLGYRVGGDIKEAHFIRACATAETAVKDEVKPREGKE